MKIPEYAFKMQIIDLENGEEIVNGSAFIPNEKMVGKPILGLENMIEEAAEVEFWSAFRAFRNKYQEEHDKEVMVDSLTPEDEEKLKDEHAKDYHGTDDDMPDEYEAWLECLTVKELKLLA